MKNSKLKIVVTTFVLLKILTAAFGQNNSTVLDFEDAVIDPYLDYFSLPQEQIYTHFNKSSYVPGEAIWFKCYAFNPKTKRPSIITNNLIVELYDSNGKLVDQKILHVEQGVTDNVFFLDNNCPIGEYTFRAYTSWMKNFNDLSSFSTYFSVIGNQQQDTLTDNKIDVQFLPESGTLLEGLTNKVGIKAVDINGKGVKLFGDIIDEKGVLIKSFELNKLGMGNVVLDMTQNAKLNCRINLTEEKELIYPLPQVEKQGIIAQVNQHSDKIFVKVVANRQTILNGQVFYLMIHNKGEIQVLYSIKLDPEKKEALLEFDKSELINGVNCLSIFNEKFEPVAERLFYVKNTNIKGEIKEDVSFSKDTVSLKISSLDMDGKPVSSNLSLSVLPEGSACNDFSNSLMAEILLKAGLKGTIEKPNYYFEDDTLRLDDLDNLLITQGWRKYNWQLITDTTSKTLDYEIEEGFNISGKVQKWSKSHSNTNCQVFLHSSDNRILKLAIVDSLGGFSFNNLYLTDSSLIYSTIINEKGKVMDKEVNASVTPIYKSIPFVQKPENIFTNAMENLSFPANLFSDNTMIEEVVVFGKKPEPPPASIIFNAFQAKTFTITNENSEKYHDINDILRQEFGVYKTVSIDPKTKSPIYDYSVGRGRNSINLPPEVLIIIDDIPVRNDNRSRWNDINNYCSISNIESISVNKTGFGLGARGVDGAIIIKTRRIPISDKQGQKMKVNKLKVRGYSTPVAYYTPKYKVLPPDLSYLKYATVFWQPNVLTDQEGKTTIKFSVPPELNAVEIRIEGFTDNGAIFLENKKIEIP